VKSANQIDETSGTISRELQCDCHETLPPLAHVHAHVGLERKEETPDPDTQSCYLYQVRLACAILSREVSPPRSPSPGGWRRHRWWGC